jgi:hypothetical protein
MKQTLKTSIVGAALMMSAVTAQNAAAGNLVIDVDGIAGGTQLNLSGLGSSLGNFLAESALLGSGANINEGATTVYAQYGIRINQPGCLQCELTVLYSIPMTSALDVSGNELSLSQTAPGTFKMWFDTSGDNISNAGTENAQITGNGYGDGVLLLEGAITVVPPLTFTRSLSQPIVDLDAVPGGYASNFDTIQGTGSTILEIDLTFQAPGFVLSNVTGGALDLQITNTLRLNYTNNTNNRASMAFADVNGATPNAGTIVPNFGTGANPLNDFSCNNLAGTCDFIAQSNITFLFFETPEPGTLALIGGGLVLFGGLGARRQKKAAA